MSYAFGQSQGIQQLPFSPQQPQVQPVQYPVGQPPVLPQAQYLPPMLQQFYPLIVWQVIDELSSKAVRTPLRTFLFNMMASSGFQSPEFMELVTIVTRHAEVELATRQQTDPQQAIRAATEFQVGVRAAMCITQFPGLLQVLSPELQSNANIALQHGQGMMQKIQQFYQQARQMAAPGYGYGAAPGYGAAMAPPPGPAWPMPGMAPAPQQLYPQAGYGQPVQPQPLLGQHTGAPSGMWQRQAEARAAQAPAVAPTPAPAAATMWRPGAAPAAAPQAPAAVQPDRPQEFHHEDSRVKWKPSVRWPAVPAFNPKTHDLFYIVHPEGIEPRVREKDVSEDDLQTPWYVKTPAHWLRALDTSARIFRLERGLREEREELEEQLKSIRENPHSDDPSSPAGAEQVAIAADYKERELLMSSSRNDLWQQAEIRLLDADEDGDGPLAYRAFAHEFNALVSVVNPDPLIGMINQFQSFREAAVGMRGVAKAIRNEDPKAAADLRGLMYINRRLTESVNHYVSKELGLPSGTIDSFMDDIDELMPYIAETYDQQFVQMLEKNQAWIMHRAVRVLDEAEVRRRLKGSDPLIEEDENVAAVFSKMCVTYFYDVISLTALDMYAAELQLTFPRGVNVTTVLKDKTPTMWRLAENVLAHGRSIIKEGSRPQRNYVRTADGVEFEITASAVNHNFILVSLV